MVVVGCWRHVYVMMYDDHMYLDDAIELVMRHFVVLYSYQLIYIYMCDFVYVTLFTHGVVMVVL
jgi:hypothetical protein